MRALKPVGLCALAVVAACGSSAQDPRSSLAGSSVADVRASAVAAAGPTPVKGFIRELRMLDVTLPNGDPLRVDALITRPEGPARLPLVVLNHGSPRDDAKRPTMSPTALAGPALAFARHGYAAVSIMRRGYGQTPGPYVEKSGRCNEKYYGAAARASGEDVLAAVSALRRESWVDGDHVLLVGHSAGGVAVLTAGATNPRGVVGTVSFAGGRGSDAPDHVCQPERLVELMGVLGATARIPSVWAYAPNDHFFAPDLVAQMVAAYRGGGAPVDFVSQKPFGTDGHYAIEQPASVWWPDIAPFLTKVGLPTALLRPRVIPSLPPPAGMSERGKADFARYLELDAYEKAFATDGRAWGWVSGKRTRAEAKEGALAKCKEHSESCTVYSVGDD